MNELAPKSYRALVFMLPYVRELGIGGGGVEDGHRRQFLSEYFCKFAK